MKRITKIDDSGRMIIPKQVREKYNMKTYDTLLLSTNEKGFTLKKEDDSNEKIINKIKYLENTYNMSIILVNSLKVIYTSKSNILEQQISNTTKNIIKNKKTGYNENIEILNNKTYNNVSYTYIELNNNKGCLFIINNTDIETIKFIFEILK